MTINSSTLRPGLLVSLKTSVTGNVSYQRREIEAAHITAEGEERAAWETKKRVTDAAEHKAAEAARSKAQSLIRSVCTKSAFGLMCPESAKDDLDAAMREAREVTREFNETAALTRISVNVITGRIAPDDVEAIKSINSEIADLMELMTDGIRMLDVKKVRDAAAKARGIGQMLNPGAQERVFEAVNLARKAASKIVAAGDQAAKEIDRAALRKITEARGAFLDFDDATEVSAPKADARALDLEPIAEIKSTRAKGRIIDAA